MWNIPPLASWLFPEEKRYLFGVQGQQLLQTIPLPAIPDIKWSHRAGPSMPVAAIGDTEGSVNFYQWSSEQSRLGDPHKVSCAPNDILCLAMDWSGPHTAIGSLVTALSNGSLALIGANDSTMTLTSSWPAHDYEPWAVAWDTHDRNRIYSGGDDLCMKVWDVRQPLHSPVTVNKRFDAGVTTIQSHPHLENLIAVGSYDETVRLLDPRMLHKHLSRLDVGSGAWRVKWHPDTSRKQDLLVACMRDGFKVLRVGEIEKQMDIVGRFKDHDPEKLCYGIDWSHCHSADKTLVASCSFYDHLLHIWYA